MAPLRLGITGIFPCFLIRSREGRAVIIFMCNNMDDCVPISPNPQLIKDCHIKLITCRQTSTAKEPLTEAHMDLQCFSPFFPAQWRVLFFNTPDPKTVQANFCAVDPNQIHFNLLSLLQSVQQRPKKTVFTHMFESCIKRMPIPKTGGQISPANPSS